MVRRSQTAWSLTFKGEDSSSDLLVRSWFIGSIRGLAIVLLLQVALACSQPQFVYASGNDLENLRARSTFCIAPERNRSLFIWDMQPTSCEGLGNMVASRFREQGYVDVPLEKAELQVVLSGFVGGSTRSPRSIHLVMEVLANPSKRCLWSGEVELPWMEGSGFAALQAALADFLKVIPTSNGDPRGSTITSTTYQKNHPRSRSDSD